MSTGKTCYPDESAPLPQEFDLVYINDYQKMKFFSKKYFAKPTVFYFNGIENTKFKKIRGNIIAIIWVPHIFLENMRMQIFNKQIVELRNEQQEEFKQANSALRLTKRFQELQAEIFESNHIIFQVLKDFRKEIYEDLPGLLMDFAKMKEEIMAREKAKKRKKENKRKLEEERKRKSDDETRRCFGKNGNNYYCRFSFIE